MNDGLTYESLETGARLGTFEIAAGQALVEGWRDIAGFSGRAGELPEGCVFILGLRALMDLSIIPPGGVLAGHDLHFFAPVSIGDTVSIDIVCTDKQIRKARPFAILTLTMRVGSSIAIVDHMRVLWPTADASRLASADKAPANRDGVTAEFPRRISQSEVQRYADLSHDRNPIHLDETYAEAGPFGGLVVHAVIPAGAMLDAAAQAAPAGALNGQRANVKFLNALRPDEAYRVDPPVPDEDVPTWRCRTADGTLICIAEIATNEG